MPYDEFAYTVFAKSMADLCVIFTQQNKSDLLREFLQMTKVAIFIGLPYSTMSFNFLELQPTTSYEIMLQQ
jgi:hypothetical protein